MSKFAIVKDNTVIEIVELIEEQDLIDLSAKHQMVIDTQGQEILPGFILKGNALVSPNTIDPVELSDMYQQTAQRLFGQKILPGLVDQIGARNLKLTRDQITVDVTALGLQMNTVQILLNGGALKTARGLCSHLKSNFPKHADILDLAINQITAFLIENKWN